MTLKILIKKIPKHSPSSIMEAKPFPIFSETCMPWYLHSCPKFALMQVGGWIEEEGENEEEGWGWGLRRRWDEVYQYPHIYTTILWNIHLLQSIITTKLGISGELPTPYLLDHLKLERGDYIWFFLLIWSLTDFWNCIFCRYYQ